LEEPPTTTLEELVAVLGAAEAATVPEVPAEVVAMPE